MVSWQLYLRLRASHYLLLQLTLKQFLRILKLEFPFTVTQEVKLFFSGLPTGCVASKAEQQSQLSEINKSWKVRIHLCLKVGEIYAPSNHLSMRKRVFEERWFSREEATKNSNFVSANHAYWGIYFLLSNKFL